jgi:hypothetical protein
MASVRVESYLRLVAQKAWETWRKLPPQHRAWMDVEDLIQDGVLFARKCAKYHNPKRTKFTTYLSASLDNFYRNKVATCFYKKRNGCEVVPLDAVQSLLTHRDETENRVHAEECLEQLLSNASPVLREYLCRWLFSNERVNGRGGKFHVAKSELLLLSKRLGFNDDDFRLLLLRRPYRRAGRGLAIGL